MSDKKYAIGDEVPEELATHNLETQKPEAAPTVSGGEVPSELLTAEKPLPSSADGINNPKSGAAVGAVAGIPAGLAIGSKYAVYDTAKNALQDILKKGSVTVEGAPSGYASPYGVGEGALKNAEHNVNQIVKNKVAQAALDTPGFASPGNSRILMPEQVARSVEQMGPAAQDANALAKMKAALPQAAKFIGGSGGIGAKALNVALPVASLAGAGAMGADATRRWQHGDKARAVISGLGALGSAATAIPTPYTRIGGTALSVAAPLINEIIDRTYGREGYAEGGMVEMLMNDKKPAKKSVKVSGSHEDAIKKIISKK